MHHCDVVRRAAVNPAAENWAAVLIAADLVHGIA